MAKPRTNAEHVQLIREGKDYYSPRLAINETIDHLVDCALIVKASETNLTAETRALDAIGVQVARELKNRAEMIHALTDRLQTVETELKALRNASNDRNLQELRGEGQPQVATVAEPQVATVAEPQVATVAEPVHA